jgi:hypothetical protein
MFQLLSMNKKETEPKVALEVRLLEQIWHFNYKSRDVCFKCGSGVSNNVVIYRNIISTTWARGSVVG